MCAHFVCALLGFRACEFPVKPEKKTWTFIADQRSYITKNIQKVFKMRMLAYIERLYKLVGLDIYMQTPYKEPEQFQKAMWYTREMTNEKSFAIKGIKYGLHNPTKEKIDDKRHHLTENGTQELSEYISCNGRH